VTKKTILQLGVACLAVTGFAGVRAHGALILNLNSGAVVVTDNGAGDTDPAVGRITNTSTVAGFGVAISVAQSNSPGTPTAGLLSITSLDIQNLGGATASLRVQTSDTGYTAPGAAATPMTLQNSIGGTFSSAAIGNTVTFQSFADPANAQPAAAVSTAVLTATKSTAQISEQFSGSNQTNWSRAAGPYSLSNVAVITLSSGGQVNISGTTTATAVPEPASLGFLATGAGLLTLRRRKVR